MKKKIVLLTTAFLMTVSVIVARNNATVPEKINQSLQQDFKNVSNIQWKTTENYYKATFHQEGQQLEAFYSFEGTLIATSRYITVNQLPLSLIKEVSKLGTPDMISDLFELLTEKGTEYFITIKNDKTSRNFRSTGYTWSRY